VSRKADVLTWFARLGPGERTVTVGEVATGIGVTDPAGEGEVKSVRDLVNRLIAGGELPGLQRQATGVYRVVRDDPYRMLRFVHVGFAVEDGLPLVRSELGYGRVVPVEEPTQQEEGRG
jgi:hypothetical protein